MARPSKSVKAISKNLTKEEIAIRMETEDQLRGGADKISPPEHLNEKQREIFKYIVEELKASAMLGNLDIYILATCSIALDRIQTIEDMINKDPGLIKDKDLRLSKSMYTGDFFRACNELSLSPQSRAKLGNINLKAQQKKEDPLLSVLSGGKK